MYVLRRTDGLFVSKSGAKNSYTNNLLEAQTFGCREQAESNRCVWNEYIEDVDEILN